MSPNTKSEPTSSAPEPSQADRDFVFAQCIAFTLGGSSDYEGCVRQRGVIMDHLLPKLRIHTASAVALAVGPLEARVKELEAELVTVRESFTYTSAHDRIKELEATVTKLKEIKDNL